MNHRAFSLDAFRGFTILAMILSGTIINWVLPAWMSHAQVGPRSNFAFDPSFYGITWVDLVFPFFLFAMGASFPFSLGRKLEKGKTRLQVVGTCVLRGIRLTFFAIFIQHMYPWSQANPQHATVWGISMISFFLMFPMFMRFPFVGKKWRQQLLEGLAYVVGITLLLNVAYVDGKSFSLAYSNIIILVLANMAIWGGVIYILTYRNRLARMLVLPFLMALMLSSATDGSWAQSLTAYSPLPWLYQFNFLKYLFVVIPGSIAGEYLYTWLHQTHKGEFQTPVWYRWVIAAVACGIVVWNLYGLFTRQLLLNLMGTMVLVFILYLLLRQKRVSCNYWWNLLISGAYLLLLGLCFEAFQGGIRKDDATYSYFFVTSGLAFLAMLVFSIMSDVSRIPSIIRPLELAGQNPMIAYVAPQLLIMPLLNLCGLTSYLDLMNNVPLLGFLRGCIVTALSVAVACVCSYKKWFWRT